VQGPREREALPYQRPTSRSRHKPLSLYQTFSDGRKMPPKPDGVNLLADEVTA